ncbi:MAG TPA: NAD-dependent epimerase/dehydratase family protein, partial [Polyangiaceae bacterium]|nr:NAD-dependent epimerase/dehydratase family protein [Polyangiaceae bacterium]
MSANFWQDRPTLVTGATGLLGSWLTRRLVEAGADVVALVRDWVPESELVLSEHVSRVKIVRGDVTDGALLERVMGEFEIDTVFHLAAQTIVSIANRNPLSTFETNVRGTWLLLEAARRSPRVRQVVVASSDKAYGSCPTLPYTEDTPLRGEHPYDVSKSCADLIAQSYAKTYQLPVVVTRCGNFYGGGDLNWNRIVPGTIRSLYRKQAPVIRSDGKYVRDYIHVDDGAAAYMLLAERLAEQRELAGLAFNFSTHERFNVLELVERIRARMMSPLSPVVMGQATGEIVEQSLNADFARQRLGWRPLLSLEQGLDRTIEWYEKFFARDPASRRRP